MRVLHILNELKPSGAELMYLAAVELWQAHGLECEILATGAQPGTLASRMADAGFKIHHLPFRRSPRFPAKVCGFLRSGKYDAVHIDTERAWYALAAYAAGVPCVVRTIHNNFPFRGLLRLRRAAQRWLMRRLRVRMIAVSPSVQSTEAGHFHNPAEVVWNWFDDRRFRLPSEEERTGARDALGIASQAFVILSVGGCSPVKNHGAIIDAVAACAPEIPLFYLHAGEGPESRSERKRAILRHVENRVRFLGQLPHEQLVLVLRAADAFLMPSLHEGLSCAAVEAMASGLPAIFSAVPGLRDFQAMIPGIRWIEPTAGSLASAVRELHAMPREQRWQLGAKLSAAAHREFGRTRGAMQYLTLYGCGVSHQLLVPNVRTQVTRIS
ncbi:MAG TPA: glycosyltransferase family 4 protein [Terriglobales bacterium]|nr:glycosyltransferase family 4 protein [Terriglobales bacterium]